MRTQRGFTLFEFSVVAIVALVVLGALFTRIPYYQEQAEKAAMEKVVATLQSTLMLRYGVIQVRGGTQQDLVMLASDNPMDWLQQKPDNYAGEYYDPTPTTVAPGRWMFDLGSHDLIYVVDRGEHFIPGKDGHNWIRFRIKAQYERRLGDAASGKMEISSLLLESSEPYRWFN